VTRLELVQKLVELAGISSDGGPSTTENQTAPAYIKAISYIDHAYEEIQNFVTDWKFLWSTGTFDTVAAQTLYDAPADLASWDINRIKADDVSLEVLDYHEYHAEDFTTAAVAQYAIIRPDNKIIIEPEPTEVQTITYDYFTVPDVMTVNTDEPIFPARFHMILVARALMMYGNYEVAEEIKQQGTEIYQQYWSALKKDQLPNQDQRTGRHQSAANLTMQVV